MGKRRLLTLTCFMLMPLACDSESAGNSTVPDAGAEVGSHSAAHTDRGTTANDAGSPTEGSASTQESHSASDSSQSGHGTDTDSASEFVSDTAEVTDTAPWGVSDASVDVSTFEDTRFTSSATSSAPSADTTSVASESTSSASSEDETTEGETGEICAQGFAAAAELEPNNSSGLATALSNCSAMQGDDDEPSTNSESDWYEVTVPSGMTSLTLEIEDTTEGPTSSTSLVLFSSSEVELEARTAAIGKTESLTTGVLPGVYFVRVLPSNQGTYELRVSLGTAAYEFEELNDNPGTSAEIEEGVTVTGQDSNSSSNSEYDWYSFTVTDETAVTVTLHDRSSTGTALELRKPDSVGLEALSIGINETSSRTTGVVPGKYFILVTPGNSGQYELSIELSDENYEIEETNDAPETAQYIQSEVAYEGHDSNPNANSEYDWFRVTVPEGKTSLTVQLTDDSGSGTSFELRKPNDTAIEGRTAGVGETASLKTGVVPSDYYILVTAGNGGSYTLVATLGDELLELEESNDASGTAQVMVSGATYWGQDSNNSSNSEYDWFSIDVGDSDTSLTFSLTDVGGGAVSGASIVLYNSALEAIESREPGVAETVTLTTGVLPGKYLLRVVSGNGRQYEVSATTGASHYEVEEINDAQGTAQVITPEVTYRGRDSENSSNSEYDWYAIAVPSMATSMTVTVKDVGPGSSSGGSFAVYNEATTSLGSSDLAVGLNRSVTVGVVEDTYYVRVVARNGSEYDLTVEFDAP